MLETTRERGGGLRLLNPAESMALGGVVRQTESDLTLLECFDSERNACRLKEAMREAMNRYMEVFGGVTLADLIAPT